MSLFTRVIGSKDEVKIGLHKMQAIVSEVNLGRLTFDQSVEILGLVGDEVGDLLRFFTALNLIVGSKLEISQTVFNYLVLGEMKITNPRNYTNEDLFWQMVEAE